MRVRLAKQVADLVGRPAPRQPLRQDLRHLASETGDIQPLEGPLQEYCRLRIGAYRVILRYASAKTIECVFAERRAIVYEAFAEVMVDRLLDESKSGDGS